MSKASDDNIVFIPDGPVSSMVFLPVVVRALESKKRNSLLTDHKAMEIYDRISDLRLLVAHEESLMHYTIICRTLCFDRLIKDFLWRYPSGIVVNIGCGLETTMERLDAKSVQWYDVDFPGVIELRKQFFPETERRKLISSSFFDDEWHSEISFNNPVLIYAEGVLCYFSEEAVRKLFRTMSLSFPNSELMFDVISPAGIRAANRIIRLSGLHEGPFLKWGLKNYKSILSSNKRLRFLGRHRIFHQGYPVPLRYFLQGYISDFLSIENILHLKIRYDYRHL